MGNTYSYFARAIRGGRGNLENCRIIVGEMEKYSKVLTKHVVSDDVDEFEKNWEREHPQSNVFQRDMNWLKKSEYFVADVSVESSGTGFEIATAYQKGVPVALFCREEVRNKPTLKMSLKNKTIEPTLEELLNIHDLEIPIFYLK